MDRLKIRAGIGAGDGGHDARNCAGSVPDVEVPGGIRDDQRGRVREEVQRATAQVHEEKGCKARLPTYPGVSAGIMKIKRRTHPEYAYFAFNRYEKYVSFFKFALIFQGSTCYDRAQMPLRRWRFLRTHCWAVSQTYSPKI